MTYQEWKGLPVIDSVTGSLWGYAGRLLLDSHGRAAYIVVQPQSWPEPPRAVAASETAAAPGCLITQGREGIPSAEIARALACVDLDAMVGRSLLSAAGDDYGTAEDFLLEAGTWAVTEIRIRGGGIIAAQRVRAWGQDVIILSAVEEAAPPQEAPSPSPAKTAPPPEAGELVTTFIDSGEQAVISLPEKPPAPPDQGTAVVLEDVKKPLPPIVGGRVVADVKDEAGRLIARSGDRVTEGMIRQAQQAGRVVALTASVVMDG